MTTLDKAYRWWYRDPLTKILFKGTFAKIGVRNLRWTNYASVTGKTPEKRDQMLRQTEQAFAALRHRPDHVIAFPDGTDRSGVSRGPVFAAWPVWHSRCRSPFWGCPLRGGAVGLLGRAAMVAVRAADLRPRGAGLGRDGRTALTVAGTGRSYGGPGGAGGRRWRRHHVLSRPVSRDPAISRFARPRRAGSCPAAGTAPTWQQISGGDLDADRVRVIEYTVNVAGRARRSWSA